MPYKKYSPKWRAEKRRIRIQRRPEIAARIRLILLEAKGRPCADCDIQYPPCVMEFDHVHGEKKFKLAVASCGRRSFKQVEEEIAKCNVVCANCHRLRHNDNDTRGTR